ncbi:hypothetical protein CHUAL_012747 [Chamberlinius hualienensis]
MVTRAGKDLLKNTIRSTDYHNKLLQEDEMWRQWDIEQGLTMMVTDDAIRNRLRMDSYKTSDRSGRRDTDATKLQKQKEAARESRKGNYWSRKLMEAEENDPDRWGHSGYRELYPEEFKSPMRCTSAKSESSEEKLKSRSHKKKHKKNHKDTKKSSSKSRRKKTAVSESESHSSRSHRSSSKRKTSKVNEEPNSSEYDCDKSPNVNCNGDKDIETDLEVFPNLSNVSASDLAKRREYLKRKLKEYSPESFSAASFSYADEFQNTPKNLREEHKRRRQSSSKPHNSSRIKSQIKRT